MLKIFRENKLAIILFVLSLAAAVGTSVVFFAFGGDSLPLFGVQIVAILWLCVQARIFFRILSEYGVKNPVKTRLAKIFRRLSDGLRAILEFLGNKLAAIAAKLPRFNMPQIRKRSRIKFFQDEKTRIEKNRVPFRKMKWKNLQNNRQRVRFIYISFLQRKIKKGTIILPSETPNELAERLHGGEELFPLYNVARYAGDDASVEAEDVEKIIVCAGRRLRI